MTKSTTQTDIQDRSAPRPTIGDSMLYGVKVGALGGAAVGGLEGFICTSSRYGFAPLFRGALIIGGTYGAGCAVLGSLAGLGWHTGKLLAKMEHEVNKLEYDRKSQRP